LFRIFFAQSAPHIAIRISSLEPTTLTSDLIRLVAKNKQFRPHFHIPLQSGSDEVLQMMNRKYRRKHYEERIRSLHQTQENVSIGTDVIVGFPGETENDFVKNL